MKKIALGMFIASIAFGTVVEAKDTYVDGYVRKDGTYVAPHVRSAPNRSTLDNWSTQPNYNPYTGEKGTQNPYPQPNPYTWNQPRQQQPTQQPWNRPKPVCPYGANIC